jgi:hypothetical protein
MIDDLRTSHSRLRLDHLVTPLFDDPSADLPLGHLGKFFGEVGECAQRLATVPAQHQFVTVITVGEFVYGARRVDRPQLISKIELILCQAQTVLPFDITAARTYGSLRVQLE